MIASSTMASVAVYSAPVSFSKILHNRCIVIISLFLFTKRQRIRETEKQKGGCEWEKEKGTRE